MLKSGQNDKFLGFSNEGSVRLYAVRSECLGIGIIHTCFHVNSSFC